MSERTACDNLSCVGVEFTHAATRCTSSECVDVSFMTACDSSSCVEVGHADGLVVVSDTKDPGGKPITFLPHQWQQLLERVRAEAVVDWSSVFFPLVFDQGEIDKFKAGVIDGKFDLPDTP